MILFLALPCLFAFISLAYHFGRARGTRESHTVEHTIGIRVAQAIGMALEKKAIDPYGSFRVVLCFSDGGIASVAVLVQSDP